MTCEDDDKVTDIQKLNGKSVRYLMQAYWFRIDTSFCGHFFSFVVLRSSITLWFDVISYNLGDLIFFFPSCF